MRKILIIAFILALIPIAAKASFPGDQVPIVAIHKSATEWDIRQQVPGAAPYDFVEWMVGNLGTPTNAWVLQRIQEKSTPLSGSPVTTLTLVDNVGSVFESVGELVLSSVTSAPPQYTNYYGEGHGNVVRTTSSIMVDGVASDALTVGKWVGGQKIVFEQTFDILNPATQVIAGLMRLRHTFTSDGLLIEHWHQFLPGYAIFNVHAALLPLTTGKPGSMKFVQVGTEAPVTLQNGGATYLYATPYSSAKAWSDTHPYSLQLTLTDGTSGQPDGFAHAIPEAFRILDSVGNYSKLYVEYVWQAWDYRIPATAHSHSWRLQVQKN